MSKNTPKFAPVLPGRKLLPRNSLRHQELILPKGVTPAEQTRLEMLQNYRPETLLPDSSGFANGPSVGTFHPTNLKIDNAERVVLKVSTIGSDRCVANCVGDDSNNNNTAGLNDTHNSNTEANEEVDSIVLRNENELKSLCPPGFPNYTTYINATPGARAIAVEISEAGVCPVCLKSDFRSLRRHMIAHLTTTFPCPFSNKECLQKRRLWPRRHELHNHLLYRHFRFLENPRSQSFSVKLAKSGRCPCGWQGIANEWIQIHLVEDCPYAGADTCCIKVK